MVCDEGRAHGVCGGELKGGEQIEQNKATARKPKFFSESRNVRVRLTDDAADIVNGLWLRTGLSATEIVSRMVEFAAERVEVEKTAFDE